MRAVLRCQPRLFARRRRCLPHIISSPPPPFPLLLLSTRSLLLCRPPTPPLFLLLLFFLLPYPFFSPSVIFSSFSPRGSGSAASPLLLDRTGSLRLTAGSATKEQRVTANGRHLERAAESSATSAWAACNTPDLGGHELARTHYRKRGKALARPRPRRRLLLGESDRAPRRVSGTIGAIALSPKRSPAACFPIGESSRRAARSLTCACGRTRKPEAAGYRRDADERFPRKRSPGAPGGRAKRRSRVPTPACR